MTVEVVVFPDAVAALIPFLSARLTARSLPATVASRVPTTRPPRLVRVTQVGGTQTSIASINPLVLVECWDVTEPAAAYLAAVCAQEISAATRSPSPIAAGVWIGGGDDACSLPVNFPDPLTSSPRYQFTASLFLTGVPL
jgi:hypothetical protein